MPDERRIAGVVLAGGRSSRMGQDKAHMDYHGRTLVDHMAALLKETGLTDIHISGRTGESCASTGYRCLQDSRPFAGPAAAIRDVLVRLADYDGVLFVPVDMPFLTRAVLQDLLRHQNGAHYEGWPLPLYLPTSGNPGEGQSVRQMISGMNVKTLPLPEAGHGCFANLNTPEDWQEAVWQ